MKHPYACATPPEKISEHHRRVLNTRRRNLLSALARLPRGREPYDLEIGCGHGHFLAGYARAHPNRFCIGIDIAGARLERAQRKTDRAGVDNVGWIHGDATLFLDSVPEHLRFSRVFILFPDPWPKKRHHKHRLVGPEFLKRLASLCRPRAELYFRSDHIPYVEAVEAALAASPRWSPESPETWPWESRTVFQDLAPSYRSLVARKVDN